jgi:hypothetical protein
MAESTSQPPSRAYHYSEQQRVTIAVAGMLKEKGFFKSFEAALRELWSAEELGPQPPGAVHYCKHWWQRLWETGSVHTAPHPGNPILPNAVAAEAARIVREGFISPATHGGQAAGQRPCGFTSLGQAIRMRPQLAQLLAEYGIDKRHLLRRMHEADPTLHWGRVDAKGELSAVQRAARRTCAQWLLAKIENDAHFLDRVIFLDEVKIWLFGGKAEDIHVWMGARDQGWRVTVPCCGPVNSGPLHVCLYVAVNAKLGGFYSQSVAGSTRGWPKKKYAGAPLAEEDRDPDWKVRGFTGGTAERRGRPSPKRWARWRARVSARQKKRRRRVGRAVPRRWRG